MDSGAGLLHRLTSYASGRDPDMPVGDPRVRHDLIPNDMTTVPPFTKAYPDGLPVVALPRELSDPGVSATAALAGLPAPAQARDAAQLGRMLFLGAGVVRTKPSSAHNLLFPRPCHGLVRATPAPRKSMRPSCAASTRLRRRGQAGQRGRRGRRGSKSCGSARRGARPGRP